MRACSIEGDELQLGLADVDLISDASSGDRPVAALADLLVEALADGGWERWFRAFGPTCIECVDGIHHEAGERFEIVVWRCHELRVGGA